MSAHSAPGGNPNDEIREKILGYFYERNSNATSKFGKKGSAVKISDVKKELKQQHSLTQQQVVSNLNYLLDREWVKPIDQKKEVATKGGTTVPSVVTFYEIAAKGIEKIEGESDFQPKERYPGINIEATGTNVITLGDGNVVNVQYREAFNKLLELKERISETDALSEEDKFAIAVDIETIRDQLAKPEPNPEVVKTLWQRIHDAAALAGLAQLAIEAGQALGQLIS